MAPPMSFSQTEASVDYHKILEQTKIDTRNRLKNFERKGFDVKESQSYDMEMVLLPRSHSVNLIECEILSDKILKMLNRYPVGLMTKKLAVEGVLKTIESMQNSKITWLR